MLNISTLPISSPATLENVMISGGAIFSIFSIENEINILDHWNAFDCWSNVFTCTAFGVLTTIAKRLIRHWNLVDRIRFCKMNLHINKINEFFIVSLNMFGIFIFIRFGIGEFNRCLPWNEFEYKMNMTLSVRWNKHASNNRKNFNRMDNWLSDCKKSNRATNIFTMWNIV